MEPGLLARVLAVLHLSGLLEPLNRKGAKSLGFGKMLLYAVVIVVVIVIVLAMLWIFLLGPILGFTMGGDGGYGGFGGLTGGTDSTGEPYPAGAGKGICNIGVQPQMTINLQNKYTFAADTTASAIDTRKAGSTGGWTARTGGTAFNVEGDTFYEVIVYDESTASYGGHYETVYMPCAPLRELTLDVATVATAAAYEATEYNSDGTPNTVSANQSISAGSSPTIKLELIGDHENAYGNIFPGGCDNILVFKVNNTINTMTASGGPCKKLSSVPGQVDQATGYEYHAFSAPAHDSNKETYVCQFTIVNTDGQDMLAGDDVTATLYDNFQYLNPDDFNNVYCGVNDQDDTDSGIATEETFIWYVS